MVLSFQLQAWLTLLCEPWPPGTQPGTIQGDHRTRFPPLPTKPGLPGKSSDPVHLVSSTLPVTSLPDSGPLHMLVPLTRAPFPPLPKCRLPQEAIPDATSRETQTIQQLLDLAPYSCPFRTVRSYCSQHSAWHIPGMGLLPSEGRDLGEVGSQLEKALPRKACR